jgi:hypothetical protein
MQHRRPTERQLPLFPKKLDWPEFPQDVRQRVCHLLAAMCIEIIDNHPITTEEQNHEPRTDSIMAS